MPTVAAAPCRRAATRLPAAAPPVQGLEGALKTDRTKSLPVVFTPNAFQDELQILVNLPETIQTDTSAPPGPAEDFLNDPVVTLPFYGQNHARQHKTDKVLLDVPRPAGITISTAIRARACRPASARWSSRRTRKSFMQRAWQQVQKVYEANRKIRNFQFILQVCTRYHEQFFSEACRLRSCWR